MATGTKQSKLHISRVQEETLTPETQYAERGTGSAAWEPGHQDERGCPTTEQVTSTHNKFKETHQGTREEERGEIKYIGFQMVE